MRGIEHDVGFPTGQEFFQRLLAESAHLDRQLALELAEQARCALRCA